MKHTLKKASFALLSLAIAFSITGTVSAHSGHSMSSESLKYGSQGDQVVELQTILIEKGFLKNKSFSRGYFGPLTAKALKKAQLSFGLSETGEYDSETESMLTGNHMGMMKNMPNPNTKSADLRVLLNSINREHANLASIALRKGFDGAPDFDASFKALDNNSVEIGNSITSVYGADAGAKFLEIWRSHIVFFKNYTVASKTKDQAGKDKAVQDLAQYVNNISDFLSKANPNLPYDAVHGLVSTHVGLLKDTIDQYFNGNLSASYTKQHATDVQIGTGVADAVAGAIVKQYPDKF